MNGITHKQAKRYMLADLDGRLNADGRLDLETHLHDCETCRADSESFAALTTRLHTELHSRWDAHDGPSTNVLNNIRTQSRRIIMSNRINAGVKIFAGFTALILLGFLFTSIVKQLQDFSKTHTSASGSVVSVAEETPASLTVQEAEALAGFDVLVPSYLPEGYVFKEVTYDSQIGEVTLKYVSSAKDANKTGVISIYQKRGDFPKLPNIPPNTPYTTPVPVKGVTGEFVHGAWVYDAVNITTPRWEGDNDYYALSWKKDGMSFMVDFLGDVTTPPIQLQGLTAIAESLKHISTAQQASLIATSKSNGEWIAFVAVPTPFDSEAIQKSNVFFIHPDGSGLVNVTQDPAHYYYLQWSPDGKNLVALQEHAGAIDIMRLRQNGGGVITKPITDPDNYGYSWSPNSDKIIFADSSNGNYDIYTEYADGRNDPQLTQLTTDPDQDIGFVWSPDGSQIAYERLNGNNLSIYIMNEDGSNQNEVARGAGKVQLHWAKDGTALYASANTESNWLNCETCIHKPGIYRINIIRPAQVHQIYSEQDASKVTAWYLDATPQNTLYFMRIAPQSFLGFWGTWFYSDGNAVHEIGEWDPHQTCKATTGNILDEHISPNERFSVISNLCAGGFDLYLADRETTNPEKRLTHLLRLPSSTYGQGGDGASLPITWSPDGRSLLYNGDPATGNIYLLNIEKALQKPDTQPVLIFQSDSDAVFEIAWQPTSNDTIVKDNPTPAPTPTFRFGVPIENESYALIAAKSALRSAFNYVEPLTIITVKQESYGEYSKQTRQPLNQSADMQVWFVLYFNNEWQSSFAVPANAYNEQGQLVPVPLDARTPQPSFRGCVTVVINAENGEPVEASGPLLTGLIPECDK